MSNSDQAARDGDSIEVRLLRASERLTRAAVDINKVVIELRQQYEGDEETGESTS